MIVSYDTIMLIYVVSQVKNPKSRLEFAKIKLPNSWFSRKDYILLHKDVSSASVSRDLIFGVIRKVS